MIYLSTNRVPQSVHGQRRLFGYSLRGIALVTLFIWLFAFVSCMLESITSEVSATPDEHAETFAHPHMQAKPGTPDLPAGDCCDTPQSMPTLISATDIPIPLHLFAGLALALVVIVWFGLFESANYPPRLLEPPVLLNYLLISGSVWPNAPPR